MPPCANQRGSILPPGCDVGLATWVLILEKSPNFIGDDAVRLRLCNRCADQVKESVQRQGWRVNGQAISGLES